MSPRHKLHQTLDRQAVCVKVSFGVGLGFLGFVENSKMITL